MKNMNVLVAQQIEWEEAGKPVQPIARGAVVMTAEKTDIGDQHLLPGVSPVALRDRLQLLAAMPLTPRYRQQPCDIGLFDAVARAQLDLFIHAKQ